MSRTISFSVPDEAYDAFMFRAGECGFFGKYAVSSFARTVLFSFFDAGATRLRSQVRPVIAQPTSEEQRESLADYATLKGFPSVEAYALHALVGMTKKVPLTASEKARHARIIRDRYLIEKR